MSISIAKEKGSFRSFVAAAALIAGTMIGAGMLGIPFVTAKAGLFPALGITLLTWAFMLLTGLLYVEVSLSLPEGANILTMAERYLGKRGKVIAGGMFLFLYYCLLIAYIAGGAPLLSFISSLTLGVGLKSWVSLSLFTLIFALVVWRGALAMSRVNLILSVALYALYLRLIFQGTGSLNGDQLSLMSLSHVPFALPVLFSAFGYHNVVPSLCTFLKRDRTLLRKSIFCGTVVALIVYLAWQVLILGSVDGATLEAIRVQGLPITEALKGSLQSTLFVTAQGFAFFALVTSLLGVSFSMVDFLKDGPLRKVKSRALVVLATFVPPLVCALIDPHLFEAALGVAGGVGEAFLNGVLPVLLVWQLKKVVPQTPFSSPKLLVSLMAFALFAMGIEGWILYIL